MKISPNAPCPCGSKIKYKKCCQVFHKGKLAKTALELMKSRYSAFYVSDVNYIVKTTHKENPDYTLDIKQWKNDILLFSKNSDFKKLTILDFIDLGLEAFVTFRVELYVDNKDNSFIEKSRFFKVNNQWLYHSGEINDGAIE